MTLKQPEKTATQARTLANIELFQGLPAEVKRHLAERCRWKQYSAREHVIGEHDDSRGVFFIVQGKVRISYHSRSGHEVIFQDRCAGDLFGELATIDGKSRSANVVCIESSLIACMSTSDFLDVIKGCSATQDALLVRFSEMVRSLSARIIELSILPVRLRVQLELLRLARWGTSSAQGICILPAPTHAELANLVGMHREAVSRELSALARWGVIKKRRRMLVITDIQKLVSMSSSEI